MAPATARRILVIGCAGAGKTTFAHELAMRIGAPHVCLDAIWRPELHAADVEAFRNLMRDAHAGEAWVSDGNFARATFDIRAPRADLVVWLAPPKWLCARRAVRRVFAAGETHQPKDLAKVLAFIARFERVNRPLIETELTRWAPEVAQVRLRSRQAVEVWLKGST